MTKFQMIPTKNGRMRAFLRKKNRKNWILDQKNFFPQNGPRAARGRTTMIHDIPIIYRYFLGIFVKFRDFAIPDFGIGQKKSDS